MSGSHYITFRLDGDVFAFPVAHVREVVEIEALARLPDAPACVRGLLALRGQHLLVVELRTCLGLPRIPDSVNTRIMVLELELAGQTHHVGAVADAVIEVVELEAPGLKEAPTLAGAWKSRAVSGIGSFGGASFLVLDAGRVLEKDLGAALALAGKEAE